jgi:hypothetical protein
MVGEKVRLKEVKLNDGSQGQLSLWALGDEERVRE